MDMRSLLLTTFVPALEFSDGLYRRNELKRSTNDSQRVRKCLFPFKGTKSGPELDESSFSRGVAKNYLAGKSGRTGRPVVRECRNLPLHRDDAAASPLHPNYVTTSFPKRS